MRALAKNKVVKGCFFATVYGINKINFNIMTIVDLNNELPDLIKEYSLIRLQELDRLFPFTATSIIEDMMDDWKEESLQMKEDEDKCLNRLYPRDIKYNIHKDLGCYFSPTFTDSALITKREIQPLNHTFNKKEETSFKFLKDAWNGLGRKKQEKKLITKFELEDEILKELDYPIFPPTCTLMWIDGKLYEVMNSCVFFDKGYISVNIFEIE